MRVTMGFGIVDVETEYKKFYNLFNTIHLLNVSPELKSRFFNDLATTGKAAIDGVEITQDEIIRLLRDAFAIETKEYAAVYGSEMLRSLEDKK